jgi:hypothetical protein
MSEQNTQPVTAPAVASSVLLAAFDDALNENPFLWFELGYTRPTDWMVHVWDRRGGKNEKIICEQDPDRDTACLAAAGKLRALIAANDRGQACRPEPHNLKQTGESASPAPIG